METTTDEFAELVALRRDLHAHPELRFAEHRTAGLVAARLRAAGWDVVEGVAKTGVVAVLSGERPGPCVAVRADLDALPVPDRKTVPYVSANPGVCHACGHDVHTTVVVGLGERLARDRNWPGTVKLLFQPAEEIPFGQASGGAAMVDAGVLDNPAVDAVLGLHCWPDLPAGVIGVDNAVAMAAKDAFRIHVAGVGAHAATPSRGVDAILVASQLIGALHHLVSRSTDAGDLASLNVGTVAGGNSQSVLADSVEMTGTIRTVDDVVRERLKARLEQVVAGVTSAAGTTAEVEWANAMPALRNDPRVVARAHAVLPGPLGAGSVRRLTEPPMTTDDFALYAERVPGLYFKLGVAGPDGCHPLHHSLFDVDERAIAAGVDTMDVLVRSLLTQRLGTP
ncbi:M20 family metallopeptidase [Micromonospora sp. NPDC049679]|uniref:M20 metallopeptidase family protein n=1 Tax=Micromonospora sp. NPDC049679 TaxID=3155920 RepID=UPI00340D432B